jgi:hypothetical protein
MQLGKLGIYIQKKEVGTLPFTVFEINQKLIKDVKFRTKTRKLLGKSFMTLDLVIIS